MKIVQVLGSHNKGGAEQFFLRLVQAFDRRGIDQKIIVQSGGWAGRRLREIGLSSTERPLQGAGNFWGPLALRYDMARYRPDVTLTWMGWATRKMPRGLYTHIARLGNTYDLSSYRACNELIANTPAIVEHIRAGQPNTNVTLLPNFVPRSAPLPASRAALDTPFDVPLIFWLGRMIHSKGPDIVIRALAQTPNAYLWMAGTGGFQNEVAQLAEELGVAGRVRFLGWRDDADALHAAADIFVIASRYEALGNVILEAMQAGKPIVAARSPGPEHLLRDNVTGLLVSNDDPDDMAKAFRHLIAQPALAARLGAAAADDFHTRFGEDVVVDAYLAFFKDAVARRRIALRTGAK